MPKDESIRRPQVVVMKGRSGSNPDADSSAADYSFEFHQRVARTFGECLSVKKTARECGISARVVNEILHARDFVRKPPSVDRRVTNFGLRATA